MSEVPFVFGKVTDPANFTDRESEKAHLKQNFNATINTMIISPRRWGKSSLVEAAAVEAMAENKQLRICTIDLFNARDEASFYALLSSGVLKATSSKWEERMSDARTFLSNLRPTITIGSQMSEELSFDVEWEKVAKDPDDVLDLAERIAVKKGIKLVICIDEFQNVGGYKDSLAVQKRLRAHWQRHEHVSYCLYGSRRHMLLDIFSDPKMPFYRFGDIIMLQKIGNADWAEFICRRFAETGKSITAEQASYIADLVDNHSYYVQQLAQLSWLRASNACSKETIDIAFESMVDQLSLVYTNLVENLSAKQLQLLKAVLDGNEALSSAATLKKYNMGSSANVIRLKKALEAKEVIETVGKEVQIIDPVFKYWLVRDYFGLGE